MCFCYPLYRCSRYYFIDKVFVIKQLLERWTIRNPSYADKIVIWKVIMQIKLTYKYVKGIAQNLEENKAMSAERPHAPTRTNQVYYTKHFRIQPGSYIVNTNPKWSNTQVQVRRVCTINVPLSKRKDFPIHCLQI